jgi:hypothetical protein
METTALENYLKSFARGVVHKAKKELQSKKGSTALGESIDFKVTADPNGWSVKFYMLDYGTFLDKGVSGTKTKRSFTNFDGVSESSPYSYKTVGPPIDILSRWIKKKGIKPKGFGRGRSKNTGQYISAFAYLISKKIKREGIPSLSFFSKPFGEGQKTLGKNVLEALSLDIRTYITTFTKHKPKK